MGQTCPGTKLHCTFGMEKTKTPDTPINSVKHRHLEIGAQNTPLNSVKHRYLEKQRHKTLKKSHSITHKTDNLNNKDT